VAKSPNMNTSDGEKTTAKVRMKTNGASQSTTSSRKAAVVSEKSEEVEFFTPFGTLRPVGAKSINDLKIATPARFWGDYITEGQLGMLFGWRGAGKSTFALGLGVAMATGTRFLGFSPSRPVRTILLDGEMGLHAMQVRLRRMHESLGVELTNRFKLVSPELFSGIMPKLTTPEGQKQIDTALGNDWEVLIIDNYSAFSSGREDADAWGPWVQWLLGHKRAGRTVILVHHTGKNGTQRGASNHEDAMDFVMSLRSPKVPPTDDSLEFVVSWTKARHLSPKRTQAFQVAFRKTNAGYYEWSKSSEVDANPLLAQAKEMQAAGKTQNAIAQALGKDKSTISRWLKD
jgi:RecA-family ATPase